MKITIEPTVELFDVPLVDGRTVPTRVWNGVTDKGIPVTAYVFSITCREKDLEAFQQEVPGFMVRSRDLHEIDTSGP